MNFDRLNRANCVIPPDPVPDPRCLDSEFALSHPDVCSNSALIIRPSEALICVNDSIKFRVFSYLGGVETEITDDITFESSDLEVFVVGINSGSGSAVSGTGLATGSANITATYAGKSITAEILVLEGEGDSCCDDIAVATAIAIDNSRSMTLNFGSGYATRLVYAKSIATSYGGLILEVAGTAKDSVKPWSFNSEPTALLDDFSSVTADITDAIATVNQTQQKTDLLDIFTTITDDLLTKEADQRVLLLISDGEHTNDANRQAILDAATTFKDAGGIVIVVGVRASGQGFDLLERLATGGYFLNSTPSNFAEVLTSLNYLKSLTCAGTCIPVGDEYTNPPQLDYSSFLNWEVIQGQVNLVGPGLLDLLPGNGLYVDMASGSKALLRSIDDFNLLSGRNYRISFSVAGNQRLAVAGQGLKVYIRQVGANDTDPNLFEQTVYPLWTDEFQTYGFVFPALFNVAARIYFEQLGTATDPDAGNLLDNVLFQDFSTLTTLLDDNFDDENLTFVTPACGPSSAIVAIPNPTEPTAAEYDAPGSSIRNGEEYSYAISYLTPEGETGLSIVLSVTTVADADVGIRIGFATPPANVLAVRIWRSVVDAGTAYWLLATVNPAYYTAYDDAETHAEFATRADFSIVSPASNTTGKIEGELGTGYADCCYYFYEIVTDDELVSAIPTMTSDTTPSGSVTTNSIDAVALPHYAFDDDDNTLYRGYGVVVSNVDPTYVTPVWIAYEFPQPTTILRYSLMVQGFGAGYPPHTWLFQGSNDGSGWTTLDSQSAVTGWVDGTANNYDIASPGLYLHYRLYATVASAIGAGPDGGLYLAWNYINAFKMFTTVDTIVTRYENNCPECATEPPGVQPQDPNPLPDIESAFTPPTVYTSVKSFCATCESNETNLPAEALPWTIQTNSGGTSPVNIVKLDGGAAVLKAFKINLTGKPFNSPASYTLAGGSTALGPFTTILSSASAYLSPGETTLLIPTGTPAYEYISFQLSVFQSAQSNPVVSADSFYGLPSTSICESATRTSTVSQAEADALALADATEAAEARLNCLPIFTATESALAVCPVGQYGNSVTRSATRTSTVSQADAVNLAQAAAQALADSELDCTLSNNDQQTTINPLGKATPYPSVSYRSGLGTTITDINVSLNGLSHDSPDDLIILLVAPDGATNCLLMANCGGAAPQAINNVNLVLDQAAGSALPDTTQIVSGTFRPGIYGSVGGPGLLPEPAPQPVTYGSTLNVFNGLNPNGSWAIFIFDDLSVFGGTLDSWSLTITAV